MGYCVLLIKKGYFACKWQFLVSAGDFSKIPSEKVNLKKLFFTVGCVKIQELCEELSLSVFYVSVSHFHFTFFLF